MSGFRVLRLKNKRPLLILLIIIILTGTVIYQSYKPLPENISYEGDIHKVEDVKFLYDLTYKIEGRVEADQMIFDAVFKAIDEAEEFIVIDLFLFNGYYDRGRHTLKSAKNSRIDC
ncbi:hypothetical protein MGI18_16120 [Bacillus sp. OVS6]|nr:hypothetical protein MGI18_16120 [Bacillus sp. OVS6]